MANETDTPHTPDSTDLEHILRRKMQRGRASHQARALTLAKAFRLCVPKVADQQFELALAVIALKQSVVPQDKLEELLPPEALLLMLQGPNRSRGGGVLDQNLVEGLIQQLTMGQVLTSEGEEARSMTPTDAAVIAPFIDALLGLAAPLPDARDERALIDGFQFAAKSENPRLLKMSLEAPAYHCVEMTLDMDAGTRQGKLTLLLPHVAAAEGASARSKDAANAVEVEGELAENILKLPVDLLVSLVRLKMPLGRLSGLKVGDEIDLGTCSFDDARLMTRQGSALGRGKLGRVARFRALRLSDLNQMPHEDEDENETRAALDLPPVNGASAPPTAGLAELGAEMGAEMDLGSPFGDEPEASEGFEMPDLPGLPDLDTPAGGDPAAPTEETPILTPEEIPGFSDPGALPDLPDLPDLPPLAELPENEAAV